MDTTVAGRAEGLIQKPNKNYLEMQFVVLFKKICQ